VLRLTLIVIGCIALGGALIAALAGLPFLPLVVWLSIIGVMLVGGILFERGRYKPAEAARPDPDWVPTDERFVDPASGETVTVFYRPSTGERRYVGR
jgi:hypothetical protein